MVIQWLGLVVLTSGIFYVWFLFIVLWRKKGGGQSDRLLATGVLATLQMILSEILLGHFGFLTLPLIISLNVFISGGFFLFLLWRNQLEAGLLSKPHSPPQSPQLAGGVFKPVPGFVKELQGWWEQVKGWENIIMLILLGVLVLWLGFSAYLLPPRVFDDVYHLPPIFQYVVDHRILLLPLEIRAQFAYPENGEFLFLWVLLFLNDVRAVDIVQGVMALVGVLVIYNLGCKVGIERRLAFFLGLLFPFFPVVAGQAGSSKIKFFF